TAVAGVGAAAGTAAGVTGIGGLAAGLGGVIATVVPFALGAAAIGAAAYGVHKTLSKEVVPTVDLFADKVSYTTEIVGNGYESMATTTQTNVVKITEATQEAVQSYMDMDDSVTRSLYKQKVKQEVVTEEMSNNMITQFNKMGESIKVSQKTKFDEMTSDLTTFFNDNSSLTETREAEILQIISTKHTEQQQVVDTATKRIGEIYTIAKNENRTLKEEELNEVSILQEQMRDNAINTLSETEQEAAVIRERMKDYQGRLSAEMASEMITKAIGARDGEIKAANEKYDEAMKKSTKDAKESQIKSGKEACEGIKNEIKNATPGIESEVNIQTGKIKSGYDRLKEKVGGFFSWLFGNNERARNEASNIGPQVNGSINGYHYNGLDYVPFDGYIARLHKGERVLTQEENKEYINGNSTTSDVKQTLIFNGKVESPYEVAKASKKAMRDLQFA
ncbi:MAG: hypothetical protein RR515_06055, partial [Clostridium sp.]